MLLRRHERQHLNMKRLHDADPANRVLAARDPALSIKIALPILPTINLTLFPNPNTGKATPTPAPTQQPQPGQPQPSPAPTRAPSANPAPGAPAPSSNNGGSNNGGGTSIANAPSPSASNPASGGATNPPNSSGGGGSSGSGNSPSSGSGNSPSSGSGNGPSNGGDGSSVGSNGDGETIPSNNLGSSDFPGQAGSSDGGNEGSSGSGSSGSSNGGSGLNRGGSGDTRLGAGASSTGPVAAAGSRVAPGSPSGTGTIAAPTSTDTRDANGDPDHGGARGGFPKAAGIAIGVVLALLFLLGLILLLRRHRRAQRTQRMQKWWFTKKRTSQTYNDDKFVVPISTRESVRSSFATTYDRSDFPVTFNADLPAMPPTAEIRRARNELDSPIMGTAEPGQVDQRFSLGSVNSNDSQYLFVNHRPSMDSADSNHLARTPLFTPTPERFAFPKPPSDTASEHSNRISGTDEAEKTYQTPDTSPTPADHQNLPAFGDPFADTTSSLSTQTHTTDPFSDSTISTSHGISDPDMANPPVTALRSFASRLPDEVTLQAGDQVKMLQLFDDGWALVDKLSEGVAIQRGLVPLACLR